MKLVGHSKEGYGMSWHGSREGHLLTASEDTTVMSWDISGPTHKSTISPLRVYRGHTAWVEDVAYSPLVKDVFVSVGDDKKMMVWDVRSETRVGEVDAHGSEVNCVSFNPKNEFVVATGSADKVFKVFFIIDCWIVGYAKLEAQIAFI